MPVMGMAAMIEFIGWTAVGIAGGYISMGVAFLVFSRGGLEGLANGFYAAILSIPAWTAFFIWISPITIGVTP